MPKQTTKSAQQISYTIYTNLAVIVAVVLLAVGGLAWWAHSFTSGMVERELAAQKIYFPEKGSPAFSPAEYPNIQKYAGQLVDTGPEAKAYANDYIAHHLTRVADGKVYAEVSAEAMKDPTNQKLQQQKETLLQGETLRGVLLSTGYAYGTIGQIAKIAALVAFAGSAAMVVVAGACATRAKAV
jgi:hypothetical protein